MLCYMQPLGIALALLAFHASPTHAFTSFQPNCSLPHVSYNYVTAPNVRSTLDITWSSIATIIACTFTVLHLNVPEQRDRRDTGFTGDVKWWWKGIEPSLRWTLVTIVAPEWYAMTAIDGYLDARRTRAALQSTANDRHPVDGWSLVHAFYINMGGYAVRLPKKRGVSEHSDSSSDDRGALQHLSDQSFCTLMKKDSHELDRLPTDAEIADRSKSDVLAKCLALVQVVYFCAMCITRAIRGLPVSPLEIGTLGFALCSFVSYGFLFNKPRSVKTATILSPSSFDLESISAALRQERSDRDGSERKVVVSNDAAEPKRTRWILPPLALLLGAVHIAAWNFAFPTVIETWLWRVCTVVSMASIPLGYYIGLIPGVDDTGSVAVSIGIYGAARVVLIVEMVRTVFYLAPESFVTTWAANLPHV